jgi:hypothetical protein
MMNESPSRLRKVLITLVITAGVFFVLGIVAFFGFRNMVLNRVLAGISDRMRDRYQCELTVGSARFTGLAGLEIKNITLVPVSHDTLVHLSEVTANIRLAYALLLDYRLERLSMTRGFVQIVKDERGSNMDAFLRKTVSDSMARARSETARPNYAKAVYRLIDRVLAHVPGEMEVEEVMLKLSENGRFANFNMAHLLLRNEDLNSEVQVATNTFSQRWKMSGKASPSNKTTDLVFYCTDSGMVRIPYIDQRFHLVTGFDTTHVKLTGVSLSNGELKISGYASVSNFMINHPRISKKDVVIGHAEMDYAWLIGQDFISLDSSSSVLFNQTRFNPFIRYEHNPDTVVKLGVVINTMPAQDFIRSLPEGLFTHFKGMEAEGRFAYRLDFAYNLNRPADLLFESKLTREGLKIVRYGEANLSKLNGPFVYVPMEKGRAMRSIIVGPENPNFTPLESVSPYLKKCVLTTEDPSFFYHRGFIDEAFRQSIIKNIRTRKFARGASTISMQLVKNVFLSREKTLSRKLEEILLVYILENNHLCTKERMFEVYMNIIEWGPNVYGIGEAAEFYFMKRPSDLTLKECLFLATIIPRPKGFMWRFGKDGQVRDFVNRQFRFLSDLMVRRTVLDPVDTMGLSSYPLNITGRATNLIVKTDTLITEPMILDELPGEDD